MYTFQVSAILSGMIVTGAARSVAVQLFYQMGFEQPMFVTLLYLLGQSLSLVVYFALRNHVNPAPKGEPLNYMELAEKDAALAKEVSYSQFLVDSQANLSVNTDDDEFDDETSTAPPSDDCEPLPRRKMGANPDGALEGLTKEPSSKVMWVHQIPYYARPLIPGLFNLINSAMRWASLVYISASVAEMLISGLELVLSVLAARFIRKRVISKNRWAGATVVAIGVVLVGVIHAIGQKKLASSNNDDDANDTDVASGFAAYIGQFLIFGQCVFSVLQDLSEEFFMQESSFPATLLLGMEGLFGLAFGLMFYYPLAPLLGEDPDAPFKLFKANPSMTWYACGLTLLVTVTGILNILATAVTSSMTRNVWKNLRTALVWIFALTIYYSTKNADLGEPWVVPNSFYTEHGFVVIVLGIVLYNRKK
jgi:drug/metabolite transporter (DMT)-like permease